MKVPTLRHAFVAFVVIVAGWHLVGVTAAAVPPNRYSETVEATSDHLSPYFTQNWRLFAPNPIAEDRMLRFQASYRDDSGRVVQSEWIDFSDVELDLIRHKIVGGRGGYVTNKLIESLSRVRGPLTSEQRNVALAGNGEEPPTWKSLADDLESAGPSVTAVRSYLLYERAAARLATGVLESRLSGQEIVSVRYAIQLLPVPPYEGRNDADAESKRRPYERLSGWRRPVMGSDAERDVIAEFDERHR